MNEPTSGEWMYSGGYPAFVAAPDEDEPGNAAKATVCNLDSRLEKYQRPQDEIDANGWLIAAAKDLAAVLIEYESIEAEIILDDKCWNAETLPQHYHDRLIELQHKRNAALEKAGYSFKARAKAAKVEGSSRSRSTHEELLEAARNLELWYRAGGCRHTSPDVLMANLMAVISKVEGR